MLKSSRGTKSCTMRVTTTRIVSQWVNLLKEFDPEDDFVSVYKSRYDIDNDYEEELTCKRLIA